MFNDLRRVQSKKGEYNVCCPFCFERVGKHDDTYKLGINYSKGTYFCFRCESKGTLRELELLMEVEYHDDLPTSSELVDKLETLFTIKPTLEHHIEEFSWPLSHDKTPIALRYLEKRGISQTEIDKYSIRVGKDYYVDEKRITKWAGRILFPLIEKGKVKYVVGRSYASKTPKYLNSTGNKSTIIYGFEGIGDSKAANICEGIISSIAASRSTNVPALAFLGKNITDWQLIKLRQKVNTVFLSLDGDVKPRETREFKRRLGILGFSMFEVEMPKGQDPDELGDEYPKLFAKAKKISIV